MPTGTPLSSPTPNVSAVLPPLSNLAQLQVTSQTTPGSSANQNIDPSLAMTSEDEPVPQSPTAFEFEHLMAAVQAALSPSQLTILDSIALIYDGLITGGAPPAGNLHNMLTHLTQVPGNGTQVEFEDGVSDDGLPWFGEDLVEDIIWTPTTYVDTLEEVDISTIAAADTNCPHCWLPFGTTGEIDSPAVLAYLSEEEREETARLAAIHEMPFCDNKPNNDPVRTPCGHVFGKQCLVESLESNTTCPMCRRELRE